MKIFGILGIAAAAVLAADAADVTISGMTGNAQTDTLKLYAKNRTAKGNFTIAAMPAALVGETIVSVPRGQSAQPGTAYNPPGSIFWSRTAEKSRFRKIGRKPTRSSPGVTVSPIPSM